MTLVHGPAAMWMARMPPDAPKAAIAEALLTACDSLVTEIYLSQDGLRLALDSSHRAVAAARQDALENSRADANAILGNMRMELKDAWAAAAGARTLQAALQEQLTHEKVLARRLSDRLEHSGQPAGAYIRPLLSST